MSVRWIRVVAWALVLSGCAGAASDHETEGDRSYATRDYRAALVEYRLALLQSSSAGLRAKAAAAALHAGDLSGAVEHYAALAKASRARVGEAVDGLDHVVRAAVDARDRPAFSAAVAALRTLAPARASAAVGQDVAWLIGDDAPSRDVLDLLATAAAHAPDGGRQDSLVYLYGMGLWRQDRCDDALPAFESILRRQRLPSVASGARRGAAQCALVLGGHALSSGQLPDAEAWFTRAASDLEDESLSRAAYLGLGDVRRGKGDFPGAAEAYQRVITGARAGDTLAQAAAVRLNAMAQAGTGGT